MINSSTLYQKKSFMIQHHRSIIKGSQESYQGIDLNENSYFRKLRDLLLKIVKQK